MPGNCSSGTRESRAMLAAIWAHPCLNCPLIRYPLPRPIRYRVVRGNLLQQQAACCADEVVPSTQFGAGEEGWYALVVKQVDNIRLHVAHPAAVLPIPPCALPIPIAESQCGEQRPPMCHFLLTDPFSGISVQPAYKRDADPKAIGSAIRHTHPMKSVTFRGPKHA